MLYYARFSLLLGTLFSFLLLVTGLPPQPGFSYYDTLGTTKDADLMQIKLSYRRKALTWHPDKNQENREEAARQFELISKAYQVLGNKEAREQYDNHGTLNNFDFTFKSADDTFSEFFQNVKDPWVGFDVNKDQDKFNGLKSTDVKEMKNRLKSIFKGAMKNAGSKNSENIFDNMPDQITRAMASMADKKLKESSESPEDSSGGGGFAATNEVPGNSGIKKPRPKFSKLFNNKKRHSEL